MCEGAANEMQGLVLVVVGESPEYPEGMGLKSVPSVIRLFVLNDGLRVDRETTGLEVAALPCPKASVALHGTEDREARSLGRFPIRRSSSDLPSERVEDRVNVMEDLADKKRPRWVWRPANLDAPDILPRLLITLMPRGERIVIEETSDFLPEEFELKIGAGDLLPDRPQGA
jgi:hypothetical protein